MKTGNALLLIFAICATYFLYAQHKADVAQREAEEHRKTEEMLNGYDACTANIAPCGRDVVCQQNAIEARKNCQDFWLRGTPHDSPQ